MIKVRNLQKESLKSLNIKISDELQAIFDKINKLFLQLNQIVTDHRR